MGLVLALRYIDPDYGFLIDLPGAWQIVMCAPRLVGLKNRDLDVGYYLQLLETELNEPMIEVIGKTAFYTIFMKEPESIKIISFSKRENNFKAEIFDGDSNYVWYGLSRIVYASSSNKTARVVTSIFYNKSYVGSEKEKTIARLIVSIVTGLSIGEDSFGLFQGLTRYFYDDQILRQRKWECLVPRNYKLVNADGYGFVAYTNRVYVRIKAHYYPYSTEKYLKEYADQKLSEVYHIVLNQNKYVTVRENMENQSYYAYTTSDNQYWRVLGYWTIQKYFDISANREFSMVLEKLAVYPARIERDFLPIVYKIFASFITGPAWLSEDRGLQIAFIKTMTASIPSITPPTGPMTTPSIQKQKTTTSSTTKKDSSFVEKWRQKLKRDMKRLYEWEEKMWDDVYDTLKLGDVLSGMYTLEDKQKKTRLINTKNLATPSTHTFWKPKSDPTWSTGTVLATRKPLKPRFIHQWEKLSWHWDKEKERLHKEIKKKKKEIDTLF